MRILVQLHTKKNKIRMRFCQNCLKLVNIGQKTSENDQKCCLGNDENFQKYLFSISVCIGTNGRMSKTSNPEHHYRNLRDRYTNCTYVDGNLELTWLQDENYDLSFLQHIREVTGYVLISHVDVRRIVLPSLQIIRGRTLFKLNVHENEFALIVTLSKMLNLELPALRGKSKFLKIYKRLKTFQSISTTRTEFGCILTEL